MKFSIILPVRNGGAYVKECVNSILLQTYKEFNLLILDNESTDGTKEWVSSLSDNRIAIYPSGKSLSIEENWARIKTIPRNEFITLIGHDDILHDDYLQVMNDLILQYPDAGLYQTHFYYINGKGAKLRDCKSMPLNESPEGLLRSFLTNGIDIMGTGFMMRAKDYDAVGGIPPYPNLLFADFELWFRLAAKSFKVTSPRTCFAFRVHQSTTSISPDTKFLDAFGQFISFLEKLANEKESYHGLIKNFSGEFLSYYCRGLSHRLLRTPKSKRGGLSVRKFVDDCKQYAKRLGSADTFQPDRIPSIRLAKALDASAFGRAIFLGFKKIYSKPVLK